MPRRNFGDGFEIAYEDFVAISSAMQREIYDRLAYEMLQRTNDSFFGDSFQAQFASASSITLLKGLGFQLDATQTSPEPTRRMLYLAADTPVAVPTPDAALDRIDIIAVKAQLVDELTENRKFKDAITDVVTTESLVTQKDWSAEIVVTQGTPAASPAAPATPAGYVKVCEYLVTAVSGVSGAGAITDSRSLMPVGGDVSLNTLGYNRLTAAAGVPLSTLMGEIDALLQAGLQDYMDINENNTPDAEVGNPAADRQRLYYRDGVLFLKNNAGVKTPVGSGGGGGGGLVWTAPDGEAPVLDEEFGNDIYKFQKDLDQKLVVYVKVPSSYIAGRQITMGISQYSLSGANTQLLTATTGLIRKNNDPVDSPTTTDTSTNTALTNTVAKQLRNTVLDLTTAIGQVNGTAVSAGDILKVELERGSDTDTGDIRFIPSSTEVIVG